jgi:putative addiction module component (TIGR02574 family)
MTITATEIDLSKLGLEAKLELIGRIWESISPEEFTITDELFEELEKERADYLKNPSTGMTIQELQEWIIKTHARP